VSTQAPISEEVDLREQARLEALHSLGLLDEPAGTGITEIVRLAAEVCGVPTAVINIFDEIWMHPLASVGADLPTYPREQTPCAQVMRNGAEIITADARLEPRFAGNQYVHGLDGHLRFYASVPLTTEAGYVVGTLCTYDRAVHEITAAQVSLLRALASQIMGIFELRQALARSTLAAVQLAALVDQADEVMQTSVDAYYAIRADGVVHTWNRAAEELFGYPASEALDHELASLIVPERFRELFRSRFASLLTVQARQRMIGRRRDGTEMTVDLTIWPSRSQPGWHIFARDVRDLPDQPAGSTAN
jgi:PAS domain S-box-containing protein